MEETPINRSESEIEAILEKIKKKDGRFVRRSKPLVRILGYAAAILLIAAVGGNVFFSHNNVVSAEVDDKSSADDKIIIKLADGKNLILDNKSSDTVLSSGSIVSIVADEENTIRYSAQTRQSNLPPEINEVSVPRKSSVKLILADGTKVTLNSSSKLTFPQFFTNGKREVQLEGEAFFEVTKDEQLPFVVKTQKMEIVVTGTAFNVSDYGCGDIPNTTLVSGSVNVAAGSQKIALVPGEQVLVGDEGLVKRSVDVLAYTSWVQGKYVFTNMSLDDIAHQITRWYDVEIVFESEALKNRRFTGTMTKSANINDFLKLIELTSNLVFTPNEKGYELKNRP